MEKISRLFFLLVGLNFSAQAQMTVGNQTLYGNEWIDYTQSYVKIPVAQDGFFRLTASALQAAGIPLSTIAANRFQLFNMGKEVPMFTTTETTMGANDYIEFFGEKNKGDIDAFMYKNQKQDMLNLEYNLVNDTAAYFLTWRNALSTKRFQTIANNLTNLPTKEPWFWHTDVFIGKDRMADYDISGGSHVYLPEMNVGEGYGTEFSNNNTITLNPQFIADGQIGKLSMRWAGNYRNHYTTINVNGAVIGKDTSYGYVLKDKAYDLTAAQIKTNMAIQLLGSYEAADFNSLGTAIIQYARQFNFGGKNQFIFKIAASNSIKYLEITNFLTNGNAPILYDVTNKLRTVTKLEADIVKIALPPSTTERVLVLVAQNAATTVQANPITFVDLKTDGGNYIMIANAQFFNDGTGKNYVQDYANYRATTEGGSFKTKVIDIQQVYDQFGYGINSHPLCLRNFAFFMKKNWANPQFLVLVGKAKEFTGDRNTVAFGDKSDLPTWGFPGSDQMIVTNDSSIVPIIPIGRIPLSHAIEMKDYLDKVKTHEINLRTAPQTLADRDWMKNIIHLSGGNNEGAIIKEYMQTFADTLKASKAGVNVTTFYKTSLDPVQIALNDQIFERINKGVSLITFYGHSATSTLDFDINNTDYINNKGKYPLFIALGCSAGNCHQTSAGIAENFIFYKDKGMSAFAGTTGTSFLNSLNRWASTFYTCLGSSQYGERLGNVAKNTFTKFSQAAIENDLGLKSAVEEFQITGDPALRYFTAPGPDFLPDASSVKFEPSILTAQLDSFSIIFNVANIGSSVKDSMTVWVRQELPNKTLVELAKRKILAPLYQSTLTWRVPMPKVGVAGQNRLHIFIDSDNNINELPAPDAETNNELMASASEKGVSFYVLDNNVKPIYPSEFAIVNKKPIVLKASTSNALAKTQNYIIELDTTAHFNSPLKKVTVINQLGGVLKWQPDMNWTDNTVYYWRTTQDAPIGSSYVWQTSSFLYLSGGTEGWNQSHYYQFLGNQYTTLNLDSSRQFNFGEDNKSYDVRYPSGVPPESKPYVYINNSGFVKNFDIPNVNCYVIVHDYYTGEIRGKDKYFTEYGFPNTNLYHFDLTTTDPYKGRKGLIDLLKLIPPKNYIVLFFTLRSDTTNLHTEQWAADSLTMGTNLFKAFEAEGATHIRDLATLGTRHYAIAIRKGDKVLAENRGETFDGGAPISFIMSNTWYEGSTTSRLIGPAKQWNTVEFDYKTEATTPPTDTVYFDVIGVETDGKTETTLMKNLVVQNQNLNGVDNTKYPFLKLRFYGRDLTKRTAPQLKSWRVLYKGLTELAVNPSINYRMYSDTLQQGDEFKMELMVENISDIDADSVLIKWDIKNETNTEIKTFTKVAPLSKNGNVVTKFNRSTKDLSGKHQITVEINPNQAQPEQFTFNNFLQTSFYVDKDKRNPLLDVLFDGQRIMNNDIVSAKPYILVELRDENKFLALNDTALFKLYIQPPTGAKQQIFFNDATIRFNPATISATSVNKASIEYRPIFTADGFYQLIVKAKDVSGNTSGNLDYSIAFQVITKSSISNVLNYPNPFSTKTQFVYTLTGDSPPQYFKIQIMSVAGKVVREITQDELGLLKIGTHRTDYVWDGTDEYGNKLANGVYLYRVIAKNANGKAFESYDTGAGTSDYFKKGIGKLVIMR